ncbi:MAG TPA: exodeoxyribonuclease VII small subunit [Tepidisphaeraceae bacterium]|nr:exodeoxyribonuclease VII small subunit [Tepidisphaeraceae bacterium]
MAKKSAQTPPKNYEDAERELNDIVAEIEAGEIGLEESLARYERGRFLLQYCRGVLDQAERQIELLSKAPDGGLKSEPLKSPADPAPVSESPSDPTASEPQ